MTHLLERFLTPIATTATLAPLMGLFGTIVGMIEIFGAQNATGTNPAQLAHGISVALYNTGFGLAIAKRVCDLQGWSLSVCAAGPRETGVVFTLGLPQGDDAQLGEGDPRRVD